MSDSAAPALHSPGMGQHPITASGDPSDICIILTAQWLCDHYKLPPIWELWSECYPEDPMTANQAALMLSRAAPFTLPCDVSVPEIAEHILTDLEELAMPELAERISCAMPK